MCVRRRSNVVESPSPSGSRVPGRRTAPGRLERVRGSRLRRPGRAGQQRGAPDERDHSTAEARDAMLLHRSLDGPAGRAAGRRAGSWWRWGRVELPVQNPQPETTTSVSDALSSNPSSGIGTVRRTPVTSPCGLDPWLRDADQDASPLHDASTARGDEAASTLTLLPQAARARAGWRLPVTSFCRLINEA